jgi:prepilin-type N-terminal cleavage/methylation domain-containing protein/prepilin-type processing-associated H-X9-DG protein
MKTLPVLSSSRGPRGTDARQPRLAGALASGFTLVELLVVIAIIAILLSMVLPGLESAKQRAWTTRCMSNLRQLTIAWQLYTGDNHEATPPNNPGHMDHLQHWVLGWYETANFTPDNTNTLYLKSSHLAPYLGSLGVWRCPGDRSTTRVPDSGAVFPRVRSVSINNWLGTDYIWNRENGGDAFKSIRKTTDMVRPSPAETYVFLDEREDSINDGYFVVTMNETGGDCRVVDFPGSYHRRGANFIFADGHAEAKRWRDHRTSPALVKGVDLQLNVASPNNPDVLWLQTHATGRAR